MGWIVADREIIRTLALLKQATDLATNTLGQLFVLRWLERYGLRPPVDLYRQKRDRALAALEQAMPPGVSWNRPRGGFFLWLELPRGLDAGEMLRHARRNGVTYVPGAAFRAPGTRCAFPSAKCRWKRSSRASSGWPGPSASICKSRHTRTCPAVDCDRKAPGRPRGKRPVHRELPCG